MIFSVLAIFCPTLCICCCCCSWLLMVVGCGSSCCGLTLTACVTSSNPTKELKYMTKQSCVNCWVILKPISIGIAPFFTLKVGPYQLGTLVIHLFSVIYRGPIPPFLRVKMGPHLAGSQTCFSSSRIGLGWNEIENWVV